MKVCIGPYKNWFGPYQLAELICFWVRKVPDEYGYMDKPNWVHRFGEWLAHGSIEPEPKPGDLVNLDRDRPKTWLYRFLLWLDGKRERKIQVRIDQWDTWSMDSTLSYVVLPMLRQLKDTKHGSPWVDDEDVPEHLRSTAARPLTEEEKSTGHVDDNHEARWDWVLDEMIFAFNSKVDGSWEEQFYVKNHKMAYKVLDNGMYELVQTGDGVYDFEGRKVYQKRITNGFRLFGKYYEGLWD